MMLTRAELDYYTVHIPRMACALEKAVQSLQSIEAKLGKTEIDNDNKEAKICEIALILSSKGVLDFSDDLESSYQKAKKIYSNWENRLDTISEEEEQYVTSYANRIADDLAKRK